MTKVNPLLLLVLDGWNLRPASSGNALSLAKTEYIDRLFSEYKLMALNASGQAVGLVSGSTGNPDVGYLHLGTDQVVYQDELALAEGWLKTKDFDKAELKKILTYQSKNKSKIHCLYFISANERYGSLDQLQQLLKNIFADKSVPKVFLHLILDGVDSSPRGSVKLIEKIDGWKKDFNIEIASLSGRDYGWNVDRHWDKTKLFYDVLTSPSLATTKQSVIDYVAKAYTAGESDEDLKPVCLASAGVIQENDVIIFGNAKGSRFGQILSALAQKDFIEFERRRIDGLQVATLTVYDPQIECMVLINAGVEQVKTSLAGILAQKKLNQIYIGPKERETHLDYFFSGLTSAEELGVDLRLLPKAIDYRKKPIAKLKTLEKMLTHAIVKENHDFILGSLPHFDLAGREGNLVNAQKAAEGIDKVLSSIVSAALSRGFKIIITASHSDQEAVVHIDPDRIAEEESSSPVPLCLVSEEYKKEKFEVKNDFNKVKVSGGLTTVMPAIIELMNVK